MRISGGGGNSLRLRNESLENFEKITTQSKVEDVVRNTSPLAGEVEFVNTNSGEGSIQALTTMRSSRRFAPQDDMNFEGNGKGTQKPFNGNGLIASSPYSPIALKTKTAFTLAEVLITLGIIGIVAAMTLPTLNQAINKKVRAEQVRTVKYKFTKATEKMNSLGLIGPYASTDDFVDELQKHLKIMKRCDSSHLRECWPYDEVDLGNGKTWDISKTKTGKQLKMEDNDSADYSSNNVGIVTADGTPMILSYNKKCEALDPVKQYQWSTSDGKPVSNATAGCVAAVFEINGGAKPNKFGTDVVAFNAGGLGSSCAIEIGSLCLTAPFTPKPLTFAECEAQKDDLGIYGCCSVDDCNNEDYWAGAVKQCGGVSKMPTMAQLGELASQLYVGNPRVGAKQSVYNLTFNSNSSIAKSLGLTPEFYLWSGEEADNFSAYDRDFDLSYTEWFGSNRDNSSDVAVCVGD